MSGRGLGLIKFDAANATRARSPDFLIPRQQTLGMTVATLRHLHAAHKHADVKPSRRADPRHFNCRCAARCVALTTQRTAFPEPDLSYFGRS